MSALSQTNTIAWNLIPCQLTETTVRVLNSEAANTNVIVFELTRTGFELKTSTTTITPPIRLKLKRGMVRIAMVGYINNHLVYYFVLYIPGADPGFQVRGEHLKKLRTCIQFQKLTKGAQTQSKHANQYITDAAENGESRNGSYCYYCLYIVDYQCIAVLYIQLLQ